jgi:acyl-CoA reductase-like NAD-dependent aldehyde dehydrogenase
MNPFESVRPGHLVAGEWQRTGPLEESFDPSTDRVLGSYHSADPGVADTAIAAAADAFASAATARWRTDPEPRAQVLWGMADALLRDQEILATALALENGKTIASAKAEVSRSAGKLRHAAGLTLTDLGRSAVSPAGELSVLLKEPIGVVGIITPWNSPIILAVRSLAAAFAAGCAVVLKMPAQTALTGALLAQTLASVPGIPRGVLNVVTESGSDLARSLVEDRRVAAVSYTGSTEVGTRIMAAVAPSLTRVVLELGGKTPVLLLSDADVDTAVPSLVDAATRFAGQFCMAGTRLIVDAKIADEVTTKLARALSAVRIGPGIDPQVQMGPLIDHDAVRRVDALVTDAVRDDGAEVVVRGGPTTGPGSFYGAALVRVPEPGSTLTQTEIFGPVVTVEVVDGDESAIARANDTPYGLAASVWTADDARAQRVSSAISAGTVWINTWGRVVERFEEGGHKLSGLGRLGGVSGIAEFQLTKHVMRSA